MGTANAKKHIKTADKAKIFIFNFIPFTIFLPYMRFMYMFCVISRVCFNHKIPYAFFPVYNNEAYLEGFRYEIQICGRQGR